MKEPGKGPRRGGKRWLRYFLRGGTYAVPNRIKGVERKPRCNIMARETGPAASAKKREDLLLMRSGGKEPPQISRGERKKKASRNGGRREIASDVSPKGAKRRGR